LYLGLH